MEKIDAFIEELEKELPSLSRVEDLIRFGVIGSGPTASVMRSAGKGPSYFRFGTNQIRYLKGDVIAWVQSRYHTTDRGQENSAPLMKWLDAKIERPQTNNLELGYIFYSIEEKITIGFPLITLKEDGTDEEILALMFQDLEDMKIKEAKYWMPLPAAPLF